MAWFVKGHGLGSDFVVFDGRETPFAMTPANIRLLCDRRAGVGADGVLLLMPSDGADLGVRIFDRGGAEADTSGDGLRVAAAAAYNHGYVDRTELTIETPGGVTPARLEVDGRRIRSVTVALGPARFHGGDLPAAGSGREIIEESVAVAGASVRATVVSVGTPHAVVLVEDVEDVDLSRLGPALAAHPLFPSRTDVHFVQQLDRGIIRMLTWQGDGGRVPSSGGGACAAAAVLRRLGLTGDRLEVVMDGGALVVDTGEDGLLLLQGPVREVCAGQLSADFIARLE